MMEPSLAVDFRKQKQIRKIAEAYVAFRRPSFVIAASMGFSDLRSWKAGSPPYPWSF